LKNWLARAGQFFSYFKESKKAFFFNDKGATALEYVLIIAILSGVIVITFSEIGQGLVDFFANFFN